MAVVRGVAATPKAAQADWNVLCTTPPSIFAVLTKPDELPWSRFRSVSAAHSGVRRGWSLGGGGVESGGTRIPGGRRARCPNEERHRSSNVR